MGQHREQGVALLETYFASKLGVIVEKETDSAVIWETLKKNFKVTGHAKR